MLYLTLLGGYHALLWGKQIVKQEQEWGSQGQKQTVWGDWRGAHKLKAGRSDLAQRMCVWNQHIRWVKRGKEVCGVTNKEFTLRYNTIWCEWWFKPHRHTAPVTNMHTIWGRLALKNEVCIAEQHWYPGQDTPLTSLYFDDNALVWSQQEISSFLSFPVLPSPEMKQTAYSFSLLFPPIHWT